MWLRRFFEALRPRSPAGTADFLIVGIGNPGEKYRGTRHNVGFMVVDALAESLTGVRSLRLGGAAAVAGTTREGRRILAAKPQTFVNRSGSAVAALLRALELGLPSCLVVADDFHLPLGTIRLRPGGSDGGHNGLKSIAAEVGTGFARLRVGIGPVPPGASTVEFVLSAFAASEEREVRATVMKAAEAVRVFCSQVIDAAMNVYNS
jgi:PTH1 family peptidyl-tRNA hydrolase